MSSFALSPSCVAATFAALLSITACGSNTASPQTEANASLDAVEHVSDTASPWSEAHPSLDAAELGNAETAIACQPRFYPCASDDQCCAPNRCLNITGTSLCQQEGPIAITFDAGMCSWPSSLTSSGDASTVGCWANQTHNICKVPNGGSFNAQDGTIRGPDGQVVTDACQDVCLASEYALRCTGDWMMPASIPSPDASLGCTIIPVPTPSNVLFYCCPCE
jgi:hypothetical protein